MSDKKVKLFGLTIFKRKTKENETITRVFNIPVWKKVKQNGRKKYYLFNLPVSNSYEFLPLKTFVPLKKNEWFTIVDAQGNFIKLSEDNRILTQIPDIPKKGHIYINIKKALKLMPEKKKIALVFFMGIGDYFFITPFIEKLKRKFPHIQLDAWVSKNTDCNNAALVGSIAKHNPNISNVYYYDGKPGKYWKNYDYSDVYSKIDDQTLVVPMLYEHNPLITSRMKSICSTFCMKCSKKIIFPKVYCNYSFDESTSIIFKQITNIYKKYNSKGCVFLQLSSRSSQYTYPYIDELITKLIKLNYLVITVEKNKIEDERCISIDISKTNINQSILLVASLKEYNLSMITVVSCFWAISSGLNIPNLGMQHWYDVCLSSVWFPNIFLISNRPYPQLTEANVFIAQTNHYKTLRENRYSYLPDFVIDAFQQMLITDKRGMMKNKKKKFLGISFYKRKTIGNSTITRIFNIPLFKKVKTEKSKKYYIAGIQFFTKKLNIELDNKLQIQELSDEQNKVKFFLSDQKIKKVLIVKTDSIGDYVLIRNFWKEIRACEEYKDAQLTLLCSHVVKDLAQTLDKQIIDKFLFIQHMSWKKSQNDLNEIIKGLFNQGLEKYYNTVFFPSFNRGGFENFNSTLLKSVFAKDIIINNGDFHTNNPSNKAESNINYTKIIFNPKGLKTFEFDNNKYFFEHALKQKININLPFIENKFLSETYIPPYTNYVVINPCSQVDNKTWHYLNYARLIQWIIKERQLNVVIACQGHEQKYCEMIRNFSGCDCKILVNRPFSEIINLIYNAKMYIGNDSALFHISTALKQKTLVIARGAGWFRFTNYPELNYLKVVMAQETKDLLYEKFNDETICDFSCHLGINMVTLEDVQNAFEELLPKIYFVHTVCPTNTGDMNCAPYKYFREYWKKYNPIVYDIADKKISNIKKNDIVILGGGGLLNHSDNWNSAINKLLDLSDNVIGWGLGNNTHYDTKSLTVQIDFSKFKLLSIRDWKHKLLPKYNNITYCPCVSSMLKNLDIEQKIKRKIGIVEHKDVPIPLNFPKVNNKDKLEDIIDFISSSEIIITNGYHAMYWSTLLGKKVVLYKPFSCRYDYFKYPPIRYSGNLEEDIKNAKAYPNAKEECRTLNLEFFEKVKQIIGDK